MGENDPIPVDPDFAGDIRRWIGRHWHVKPLHVAGMLWVAVLLLSPNANAQAIRLPLKSFFPVYDAPCMTGGNGEILSQRRYIGLAFRKSPFQFDNVTIGQFTGEPLGVFSVGMIVASFDEVRMGRSPVPISPGATFWVRVRSAAQAFSPSTLGLHVCPIFQISGGKQVARVAAWWIVARVARVEWGKISYLEKQCYAVCSPVHSVGVVERPVSILVGATDPRPALIGISSFDVFPEPCDSFIVKRLQWFRIGSSHVTLPQGELVRAWGA